MRTTVLTYLFLVSFQWVNAQIKLDVKYGNMAGWGSTSEIGCSYTKRGWFGSLRFAQISSTGLGEDTKNFGYVIGAGKMWMLSNKVYSGAAIDMRFRDENINALDQPLIAPELFIGYQWSMAECQLNLGFPYFFGMSARFPLNR